MGIKKIHAISKKIKAIIFGIGVITISTSGVFTTLIATGMFDKKTEYTDSIFEKALFSLGISQEDFAEYSEGKNNKNITEIVKNGTKVGAYNKDTNNAYIGTISALDIGDETTLLNESEKITQDSFKNSQIERLVLQKVTTIGKASFSDAPLKTLYLPEVITIGDDAFANSQLTNLTLSKVILINQGAFKNSQLTTLLLPKVQTIGVNSFTASKLTSLIMPKATSIGDEAFQDSPLTNLTLPRVTTIGQGAFKNSKLTTLDLPEVITVGDNAFLSSQSLTTVNTPKATSVGSGNNFQAP